MSLEDWWFAITSVFLLFKYLILRQKYVTPYYSENPSVYKLCPLLSSNRNYLSN